MFILRIKLGGDTIRIQAKLLDEKNMYTTIQILYSEIELKQHFYIPNTLSMRDDISYGYQQVKRRMKLK